MKNHHAIALYCLLAQSVFCLGGDNQLITRVFNLLDQCDNRIEIHTIINKNKPLIHESFDCNEIIEVNPEEPLIEMLQNDENLFKNEKLLAEKPFERVRFLCIDILKTKNPTNNLVIRYEEEKEKKILHTRLLALEKKIQQKQAETILLLRQIADLKEEEKRQNNNAKQRISKQPNCIDQRSFLSESNDSIEDTDILLPKDEITQHDSCFNKPIKTSSESKKSNTKEKKLVNQPISLLPKEKTNTQRKQKVEKEIISTILSSQPPSFLSPKKLNNNVLMKQRGAINKAMLIEILLAEAKSLYHSSSNINDQLSGPYLDIKNHLLVGKVNKYSLYIFCPCTNGIAVFNEPYSYPPKSIQLLDKDFSCKENCSGLLKILNEKY